MSIKVLLVPLALAHCFHNSPSSSPRRTTQHHGHNVFKTIAIGRTKPRTRPSLTAITPVDTTISTSPPNYNAQTAIDDPQSPFNDSSRINNDSSSSTNPSHEEDAFTLLASLAATTLLQSDRRRDALGKDSGAQASSATNWIDEGSAFRLRSWLNQLELHWGTAFDQDDDATAVGWSEDEWRERRDEAIAWVRWMRSVPRPVVVDLSLETRMAANETVSEEFLMLLNFAVSPGGGGDDDDGAIGTATPTTKTVSRNKMQQIRNKFLNRIGCKLILLPSGQSMQGSLHRTLRVLNLWQITLRAGGNGDASPKPPRRAGERTERKTAMSQRIPCWVQYGGTERRYDGVDMGPAMVLEVSLAPKIQAGNENGLEGSGGSVFTAGKKGDMVLHRLAWNPKYMFGCVKHDEGSMDGNASNITTSSSSKTTANGRIPIMSSASTLQGKERNEAFASDFRHRVGGLGPQIDAIVRRVLDGRVIRPAEVDSNGNLLSFQDAKALTRNGQERDGFHLDDSSKLLSMAALEAQELEILGLTPVKGLLLYGPPGCGKTALAREIARALKARAPKIVAAPELLDRWVGGSERFVRELFHDAEAELAACNGDATRSALHRSSAEDSGEATRSSTVNQILAKLDGVQAIPNVLLIGMTNRRELLDEALLRPGRLEVQIEIPCHHGRIHTDALRKRGRLSHPLCCAIDGVRSAYAGETGIDETISGVELSSDSSRGRKRRAIKRATSNIIDYISPGKNSLYDLADDRVTGGFSGAELAGLVRCAGSIALSRVRKEGGGVDSLLITLDDVKQALSEVKD
ncbi:hypothetical protein HJC23_007543 [Cyclotella cryptica]|uniref:Vesicle-fusing ATPase n=1 Tax=Cyclotella cryptica TaxID=29204 RepID=A0ABD3QUR0_9STRA